MKSTFGLALAGLLALSTSAAQAAAQPSCASPQEAARSLLDWLQPQRWDPTAAASCLDLPADTELVPGEVAVKLKKVLDARGVYVPTDQLSMDRDYQDEVGRARVVPVPTWPQLVLEKRGDRWVYSRELVMSTEALYAETFSGLGGTLKERLPGRLRGKALGVESWQLVGFGLLLSVTLLAGLLAQRLLVSQLSGLAQRARIQVSAAVLARTRTPLTCMIGGFVFRWGVPELQLGVRASQSLLFLANGVLSVSAILILAAAVDVISHVFAERAALTESKLDDQVIPLLRRGAKVLIWAVGVVFVAQNLGIDVASLLAGLGIGGLAFALAAKDTVENLFGSVTIFTDRPFQIGDWIVTGDGTEGVVLEVGFRSTRIRTFHNSIITVPNGALAMATIDNMGLRQTRRVKTTLGLTYGTPRAKIEAYIQAIEAYLRADPAVAEGALEVHLSAFGPSSLDILVYYFLAVPDWHAELKERGRHYLSFIRLAEEIGVDFAFPSSSLYIERLPGEPSGRERDLAGGGNGAEKGT